MTYTIIIPSRSPENLRRCLAAIQKHQPDARVLVVCDGDLWETPVWFGEECPGDVEFIPGANPFVYARNINFGACMVKNDVLLLNDDAILETPDGFDMLAKAAHDYTEFGVIVPRVRGITCCREQQQPFGHVIWPPWWPPREARNHMVPFMCAYIRRDVLDRVGLLPEDALFGDDGRAIYTGEDDIYCKRVRDAGYKLGILDSVVVEHESVPSTMRTNPDGSARRVDCGPARELYKRYFGLYPIEEQARYDQERGL